ncbi:cysteine hydrolase [Candidatus Woesearchaeota archaeon]|nr:cysteine hydrolase [Candidatus Woesearchaeota archaeon]
MTIYSGIKSLFNIVSKSNSNSDLSKTKIANKEILRFKCPERYKVKYRGNFYIDESILNAVDYSNLYERINAERDIAFLLIDMQEEFLRAIHNKDKERIIRYQREMLEYSIQEGIYTIIVKFKGGGNLCEEISGIVDKLQNKDPIEKPKDSAFDRTNLNLKLQDRNIKKLYLMGINAMGCVRETAKDAIEKGYDIATSDRWIAQPREWEDEEDGGIWFSLNGELHTKKGPSKLIEHNKKHLRTKPGIWRYDH